MSNARESPRSQGVPGSPPAVRAAIAASPAFAGLPAQAIDEIARLARWQSWRQGEVIFREGNPIDAVYVLGRGAVKITTVSAAGREQLLHLLEPGDVFPRVGLYRMGAFPGTAIMHTDGSVAVIRKAEVMDLARQRGDVALALLGMMEDVIMELHMRLRHMALSDVKSRVQKLLLENTAGQQLTHQEIAAFVGAARETVSRAMAELRREGIILPKSKVTGKRADQEEG